jgi:hypothetical protein
MSGAMRYVLLLAATCFVASWFLTAVPEVPGWMAFRYALSPLWPYGEASAQGAEEIVPQVASALTNVAFVIMFAMILCRKVRRPGLFFRVTIICFVMNLYWFVQFARDGSLDDLRIGYYVWLAAFALMMLRAWKLMRTSSAPL